MPGLPPRVWLTAALLLPPAAPAAAQEPPPDPSFGSLTVSLGGGLSRYGAPWDRFWSPGPALHLSLAAPLLGGRVGAGVYADAADPTAEVPSFRTLAPYLEWGPAGRAGPLEWSLGAGVGAYRMGIDRADNAGELEAAVVGSATLAAPLGGAWSVGVRGLMRRVLTREPLDQPVLTLEVARRWETGTRLRSILEGGREGVGEGGGDGGRLLPDPWTGRRVYRARELRAMGLTSLAGLPPLLPGWAATTVDGGRWWGGPLGLSAYGEDGWELLVDGVPTRLGALGLTDPDRLALSLEAVDSVVVVSRPGLEAGRFADRGLIHVHTRRPDRGAAAWLHGELAQPTGEPGPLIHTDLGSANVDRLGSSWGAGAGAAFGPAWATMDLTSGRLYQTDSRIFDRVASVRNVEDVYPVVETLAVRGTLGLDTKTGRHRLVLARSDRDDLLFTTVSALEVPARTEHRLVGLSGVERAGGALEVGYRGVVGQDRFLDDPANGASSPSLDLDVRFREAEAWVRRPEGAWRWTAGLGAGEVDEAWGPGIGSVGTVRAYGAAEARGGRADRRGLRLEGELARVEGRWAGRGALTGALPAGPAILSATVAGSRRRPGELSDVWRLWSRGWDFPDRRGLDPVRDGADGLGARDLGSVDASATGPLGPAVVRISGGLRRLDGLLLDRGRFALDEPAPRPAAPFPVVAAGGEVAVVGAEAALATGRVTLHLSHRWSAAVGGDETFRAAFARVPAHRFLSRVEVRPGVGLRLYGRVDARSGTRWARFGGADGEPVGLDGSVTVDVGGSKRFWGGRVEVGLVARDLADADRPLHPLAASPGRSMVVYGSIGSWAAGPPDAGPAPRPAPGGPPVRR